MFVYKSTIYSNHLQGQIKINDHLLIPHENVNLGNWFFFFFIESEEDYNF